MSDYNDKLERFRVILEAGQLQRLKDDGVDCDCNRDNCKVTVKQGGKYARVDVGTSGKYMVDADGKIYGIKAYGVIHRGHFYGTLDTLSNFDWSGYVAHAIPALEQQQERAVIA